MCYTGHHYQSNVFVCLSVLNNNRDCLYLQVAGRLTVNMTVREQRVSRRVPQTLAIRTTRDSAAVRGTCATLTSQISTFLD